MKHSTHLELGTFLLKAALMQPAAAPMKTATTPLPATSGAPNVSFKAPAAPAQPASAGTPSQGRVVGTGHNAHYQAYADDPAPANLTSTSPASGLNLGGVKIGNPQAGAAPVNSMTAPVSPSISYNAPAAPSQPASAGTPSQGHWNGHGHNATYSAYANDPAPANLATGMTPPASQSLNLGRVAIGNPQAAAGQSVADSALASGGRAPANNMTAPAAAPAAPAPAAFPVSAMAQLPQTGVNLGNGAVPTNNMTAPTATAQGAITPQMQQLFRRYHGGNFDPHSAMDRQKMQQLVAAQPGGNHAMLAAASPGLYKGANNMFKKAGDESQPGSGSSSACADGPTLGTATSGVDKGTQPLPPTLLPKKGLLPNAPEPRVILENTPAEADKQAFLKAALEIPGLSGALEKTIAGAREIGGGAKSLFGRTALALNPQNSGEAAVLGGAAGAAGGGVGMGIGRAIRHLLERGNVIPTSPQTNNPGQQNPGSYQPNIGPGWHMPGWNPMLRASAPHDLVFGSNVSDGAWRGIR